MKWSEYKQIYAEVYKLHEKYDGIKAFDSFVEEMSAIGKKHNCKFCNDLLLAVAEELNRGSGDQSE